MDIFPVCTCTNKNMESYPKLSSALTHIINFPTSLSVASNDIVVKLVLSWLFDIGITPVKFTGFPSLLITSKRFICLKKKSKLCYTFKCFQIYLFLKKKRKHCVLNIIRFLIMFNFKIYWKLKAAVTCLVHGWYIASKEALGVN